MYGRCSVLQTSCWLHWYRIALAVFLKTTGRTGWTLYFPMGMMLVVTFTALIQKTIALVKNVASGQATFLVDGLQLIVAVLLMVLGVMVSLQLHPQAVRCREKFRQRGSVIQQKNSR